MRQGAEAVQGTPTGEVSGTPTPAQSSPSPSPADSLALDVSSMVGRTVGQYHVASPLGSGGMGTVFRAEDTRLGRPVALKFLNERPSHDSQAAERFLREARAASKLNHPGICVVHDIGEFEGRPFIAMELLEGRTLKHWIHEKPWKLEAFLNLSAEIADALSAAHGKGIIHRDIKPTNVFVTSRGQAKILDFGLAKLAPAPSPDGASDLPTASVQGDLDSSSGVVMGTFAYMSPEQARGTPLDQRTDIFSLGALLYEMATGKPAFDGETAATVFDAILNRAPLPPSHLNLDLPPEMDHIILKALEKDPDVRYQTARDLLADLKRLRRDSSGPRLPHVALPEKPKIRRSALLLPLGAAILLLAAIFGVLRLRATAAQLRVVGYKEITSDRAYKSWPVTDGSRVYLTEHLGPDVNELVEVASTGGESVKIPLPLFDVCIHDLSRRGTELLVSGELEPAGSGGQPLELWAVPLVSGTPRRLSGIRAHSAVFSPDDTSVAYTLDRELWVAKADGSQPRRLWSADQRASVTSWSPDGRRLCVTLEDLRNGMSTLWEVAADTGSAHRLLADFAAHPSLGRWTVDGGYLLFQAMGVDRRSDIWALPQTRTWPWRSSAPFRLTEGPLAFFHATPDRDGRRFFALGVRLQGELVRYEPRTRGWVPFLGGIPAQSVDFSRDGRRFAYSSFLDGTLWRGRTDGSERIQLTYAPAYTTLPQYSPDGSQIAFTQAEPGEPWSIRVIPEAGGTARRVLSDDRNQVDATWSPDGSELAIGFAVLEHQETRPITIQIVDLPTGQQRTLRGSEGLFSPRWSPDGRTLLALSRDSFDLNLVNLETGVWRRLFTGKWALSYPTWDASGRAIFVNEGSLRLRIGLSDGKSEVAADLQQLRQAVSTSGFGAWYGRAPDDAVLALEDSSIREVFALDLGSR